MPRSVPAVLAGRVVQRRSKRSARPAAAALIEAMEPRMLLSAAPSPAAAVPADIIDFPPSGNAAIIGTVYQDTNLDGKIDAGDTPLPDQLVYLDLNNNGVFDNNNTEIQYTATTAGDGTYEIDAPPGVYQVRVVPPPGATVVSSSPGLTPTAATTPGQIYTGIDFLEAPGGSIHGTVFNDSNANGVLDAGEPGLADRTVYVDINNNGILDSGDTSATTDTSGNYSLLVPPGPVTVRLESAPGVRVTSPSTTSYTYTITSGQVINGANFGTSAPDLSAQMLSAPPVFATGGVAIKQPAIVSVTNTGVTTVRGFVGVNLYLSLDTSFDVAADPIIGQQLGKQTVLRPGQSKTFRIHYTVPTGVASGNYHMMARALSSVPDNNPSNDVWVATPTTQVMMPFVDLSVDYPSYPNTPQLNVLPGKPFAVGVSVTNHGNVPFVGRITLNVYQSSTQTLNLTGSSLTPTPVIGRLANIKVKILPQTTKGLGITVPNGNIQRGTYFLITTLDDSNPLSDSVASNNIAIAPFPSFLR